MGGRHHKGNFYMGLVLMALLASGSYVPLAQAEQRVQQLVKGESTTIRTEYDIGDAAMTNPNVCDYLVRDNRREVYLNARAAGSVMLTLWDLEGTQRDVIPIQVSTVDAQALEDDLRHSLGLGDNVRFVRRGDRIVVEGEVASEEELHRVETVTAEQPQVESRVRIGATALHALATEIEQAVGRPGITVRAIKDRLVLEGIAYSAEAARHAEQIAQVYHRNILNLLEIRETHRQPGKRPLVYLDVYFMELKKSALRGFGVHWYPGATRARSKDGGIGGLLTSTIGFAFDLLPKIRWARERGEGRILEHPQLVVKSGDQADFFSGVEIPYMTEQQVQFKNAGITIRAEPIAYGQEVDLKLAIEVSAPAAGVDGAIDRRSLSTTAYCQSGQSVVIGGLWSQGDVTSWNKIPTQVDRASALFTLALSKDFQSRQSDFVIFVTPRIAQAPDAVVAGAAQEQWEQWSAAVRSPKKGRKIRGTRRAWRGGAAEPRKARPVHAPTAVIDLPPSLQPSP